MKITRNDIVLTTAPFLLTVGFLLFGYQMLVRQTPEARLHIPTQSEQNEILTKDVTERITPSTALSDNIDAILATVPINRADLATTISTAIETNANTIYLTLPVTLNPDSTVELANVDASSEENISRWTKQALNTAHENGLHTMLTLTINATDTVKDASTFATNYSEFAVKWAKLATEYGASFFNPGITIGHPIYSGLTPQEQSLVIRTVQSKLRPHYTGNMGINLCCTELLPVSPGGYSYITVIATPEHDLSILNPIARQAAAANNMTHIFSYDRVNSRLTQIDLAASTQ